MNTNKRGRTPIYDNAFKIAVAREYLTSNYSYGYLANKYNLAGAKTIEGFVRWYKKQYGSDINQPVKAEDPLSGGLNDGQLSQQLKDANLKIAGLEMLIEIAQKELGVDIVKKPGTKQSLK